MSQKKADELSGVIQALAAVANARRVLDRWLKSQADGQVALDAISIEMARAFVRGRLSFRSLQQAMTHLMDRSRWSAPLDFWKVYVAVEDLDLEDDPGPAGIEYLAGVLAGIDTTTRSPGIETAMASEAQPAH